MAPRVVFERLAWATNDHGIKHTNWGALWTIVCTCRIFFFFFFRFRASWKEFKQIESNVCLKIVTLIKSKRKNCEFDRGINFPFKLAISKVVHAFCTRFARTCVSALQPHRWLSRLLSQSFLYDRFSDIWVKAPSDSTSTIIYEVESISPIF